MSAKILRSSFSFASLLLLTLLFWSCSSTKTVPEGDALFAGFKIKVNDEKDSSKRSSALATELSGTVRPKPNASIFGLRPKLWIYNAFYTEKEKGLGNWIQNKLGEPPVLLSEVDTNTVSDVMSSRLHNRGYFVNQVSSNTSIKKKKATINWTANIGEPYRIRKIAYTLDDSLPIHKAIQQTQAESLLKPDDPYDLSTMTQERVRIDAVLKNKGYFYFSPDLLIFSVDTTAGDRKADVLVRIKSAAPPRTLQAYKIDDVFIHADYFLNDSISTNDTLNIRGYRYIPSEDYVKAKHLLRGVFLYPDSLYTRQNQLLTVSRLMGLPAYKFVNLEYQPDTTTNDRLDAFLYLTPALKKSLRMEAQMVNKTNGFAGPGLLASFRNRNAFKGSELLTVDFTGTFESLVGGRGSDRENPETGEENLNSNLTSYELGVQTNLIIPRIVSPFRMRNLRTEFVPKTRINVGFNFLNRVNFFQMNSYNASYGYNWRPKQTITHEITPINLQYVQLVRTQPAFEEILANNRLLQRSFEEQFIIGSMYRFTYSNQAIKERKHQFYNDVSLDVSGNMVNALQSLTGADSPEEEAPRTLFGQAYSQYSRIQNDFRYYMKVGASSQIATRLLTGVGFSYGNSSTMPYVKQFSIGGPNSIRAFRPRSIGPGTYDVPDSLLFSFFDQTGDIKLEANVEYRFPIFGFVKGALFVDAGNIWLLRETVNPTTGEVDRPGGVFNTSTFMNQLAVGTGVGVRVDIEFFVIRLDFGIPVRVPYLPPGERNVIKDFNFGFTGDTGMTLNIAIGYPF
ncbi:BamA/TamA family outer membrane protein [Pontibacter qinzhouensis]|uniref:BamA/TamA family outer membrane protein n=1 Tax=Pontibacter qinzhouensis TaxID=2603253 RepID=A0A5C8K6F5_9BACT|nr:BamA/TamA family outer membrane protein [Pontibacter qinzhouensis]TXK45311.1 BamA/TamA family outer membrane protein [Pontibacter qinzhouensis]